MSTKPVRVMLGPKIRWNEPAGVFMVDWGNIRFAATPEAARMLGTALLNAANPGSAKAAGE
jgi:hypothetical protein